MHKTKEIPDDEMLLAEMIAAVEYRGLKHAVRRFFTDAEGNESTEDHAVGCCALGALQLANRASPIPWGFIARGNDLYASEKIWDEQYYSTTESSWASLGYTFATAMTTVDDDDIKK